jgi:hypothetical protein
VSISDFIQDDQNAAKLLAILLWRLKKDGVYPNGVNFTLAEVRDYVAKGVTGERTLFVHGHRDSIEAKIVSMEEGVVLAEAHRGPVRFRNIGGSTASIDGHTHFPSEHSEGAVEKPSKPD